MTTINSYDCTAGTTGWLLSVLLHASLIVGALFFFQRIHLVPGLKPFTWNVTMVSATAQPPASSSAPVSSPLPSLVKTTTPTGAADPIQSAASTIAKSSSRSEPQPVKQVPQVLHVSSPPTASFSEPAHVVPLLTEPLSPSSTLAQRESEPPASFTTTTPEYSPEVSTSPASIPSQVAAIPPTSNRAAPADYGWLSEAILRRVDELKRYPADARIDHAEGKVVVKAVIRDDGSIESIEVFQSSGHWSLDRAAADLMRQASPFYLPRPLGKARVTIKIPMTYRFDQ